MIRYLFIQWDIEPEAFSVGPVTVRYYGLFFVLAFAVAGYTFYYMVVKVERKSFFLVPITLNTVFLSTLLGARLGECLFYFPHYYFQHPWEILIPFHEGQFNGFAGLSSHGAALSIPLAIYLLCRNNKYSFAWLLDRVLIATALAAVFIRLGNLMNSEIFGVHTNVPWGFVFVQHGETEARHPTQLYEALVYLCVFVGLFRLYIVGRQKVPEGMFTALFMVCIFTARFMIEYFKAPVYKHTDLPLLLPGQYLSLPLILVGALVMMFIVIRR